MPQKFRLKTVSKLETIFCVFLAENSFVNALTPLKGVLKRVPFIGVRLSATLIGGLANSLQPNSLSICGYRRKSAS